MLILLIAMSVSVDSLIVGISLGVKKVKIPFKICLFMSLLFLLYCSVGYIFSIELSNWMNLCKISPNIIQFAGNFLIVLLGIYYLLQNKCFNVFNNSENVDLDKSGNIDIFESMILSVMLSIDTVAAVVSISIAGSGTYPISFLFAVVQSIFLILGITLGKIFSSRILKKYH